MNFKKGDIVEFKDPTGDILFGDDTKWVVMHDIINYDDFPICIPSVINDLKKKKYDVMLRALSSTAYIKATWSNLLKQSNYFSTLFAKWLKENKKA